MTPAFKFALVLSGLLLQSACLSAYAQNIEPASFEGVVQLEGRKTVVPMVICEDLPGRCPHPEPYWILSLLDSSIQVEWSEPIAFGEPRRPSHLEIRGKQLRPGDRVRLSGEGVRISPDFFILHDIRELEVLR